MGIREEERILATEFTNKCLILADLWLNYRDEEEYADYIKYNDLGLPLAYCITNDIIEANDMAERFIDEAWTILLAGLEIEEDTGFDLLDDLLMEGNSQFQTYSEEPGEEEEEEEEDEDEPYRTVEQIQAEAYNEGYSDGFKEEQRRIQEVVTMHKRWAKENKKGNEYIFWDSVGEVLTPIEIDYSEEAYRKSLEDDGF